MENWTQYDELSAAKEGWLVAYNSDNGVTEIQKLDDPGSFGVRGESPFIDDHSARIFVSQRAESGDTLALKALKIVAKDNPSEVCARCGARHMNTPPAGMSSLCPYCGDTDFVLRRPYDIPTAQMAAYDNSNA